MRSTRIVLFRTNSTSSPLLISATCLRLQDSQLLTPTSATNLRGNLQGCAQDTGPVRRVHPLTKDLSPEKFPKCLLWYSRSHGIFHVNKIIRVNVSILMYVCCESSSSVTNFARCLFRVVHSAPSRGPATWMLQGQ